MSKQEPNRMRFLATLNNPQSHYSDFMLEDWLKAIHEKAKAVYTVGQLEKGEEGTIHVQYFVCLPKPGKRITAMKKVCKHTHWQPVGVDNGAGDYCMKEETRLEGPFEFGNKPLHQNVKGECKEARAAKNKLILENDLDTLVENGEIAISHVPQLKRAKDILDALKRQKEVVALSGNLHSHNIWIWGKAGIGKTGWYIDYFSDRGGHYNKDKSKYWNNYENQENVLINDVEIKDREFGILGNLKRWGEHQPFQAEDKYGGFRQIRPKHLIVTSNYNPRHLWENPSEYEPIERRFLVIHMIGNYYPEGHPLYHKDFRANTLYPQGPRDNNNEQSQVEQEVAASENDDDY